MWTWHMAGRNNVGRTQDMLFLIIKENMRTKGFKDGRLLPASDKMGFICGGSSRAKRMNDTGMGGTIPHSDNANPHFTYTIGTHVDRTKNRQLL